MWCAGFIREELVLYELGILNTGKAGAPKDELTKLLEPKKVQCETHVVFRHTND